MIVVPISLIGGIAAALKVGKPLDRIITTGGLSLAAVPEFVTSVILIMVFGIWLNVLPITAATPPGASICDQVYHLLLPAIALCLVLFGYIARMARAGMIEALDSDYTRTATLKGLPLAHGDRPPCLRNALLPTITVIATQLGYLIGGLVVVEIIFNYQGIGRLILTAATQPRHADAGGRRAGGRHRLPGGDADRRRALRPAQSADPPRGSDQ